MVSGFAVGRWAEPICAAVTTWLGTDPPSQSVTTRIPHVRPDRHSKLAGIFNTTPVDGLIE